VTIELNGHSRELPDGATVADAVAAAGVNHQGRGIACALNGDVVTRAEWRATSLADGDTVEIVQAVQGG
jgi:sulfur carrier protein